MNTQEKINLIREAKATLEAAHGTLTSVRDTIQNIKDKLDPMEAPLCRTCNGDGCNGTHDGTGSYDSGTACTDDEPCEVCTGDCTCETDDWDEWTNTSDLEDAITNLEAAMDDVERQFNCDVPDEPGKPGQPSPKSPKQDQEYDDTSDNRW